METNAKRIQAVYAVVPKSDGRDLFLRIGNAFSNRDGSTTLLLDAVPLGGKLHVRDYPPKEQGAGQVDVPHAAPVRELELV